MAKERNEARGVGVLEPETRSEGVNPRRISALTVVGEKVKDKSGDQAGKIEDIVFDLTTSTVSYLVLSVGGIAGIGDKLFAVPLTALTFNPEDRSFAVDEEVKVFRQRRGFDQNNWPDKPSWPL